MKIDEKCINKRLNIQKYSNAMLQFCVWCALEIEGLGANIQYYNVEIDKQKLDIPQQWNLVAQMPFGKIKEMPKSKKIKENIKIEVLK